MIPLFKTIPLHPTLFSLDVWVSRDKETLAKCFHERYGASVDYYIDEYKPNSVYRLTATKDSDWNGFKVIVMNVETFDLATIVHEINHVIFHLSAYTKIEICYESQEWVSCMMEYLFRHCADKKSFKEYEI